MPADETERECFLNEVLNIVDEHINGLNLPVSPDTCASIRTGKMLRARLGSWLRESTPQGQKKTLLTVCAATEMVHSASLCHDDVIDESQLRRGDPTLWRDIGSPAAVLTGDMLMCESIAMVARTNRDMLLQQFLSAIQEVCSTEIEQEIELRGEGVDPDTCCEVARGKTGPLFAFIALASAPEMHARQRVLQEAGYKIGTAYQLADDLIDVAGEENLTGKTLGHDSKRGKNTMAPNEDWIMDKLRKLCEEASRALSEWPEVRNQLRAFVISDMQPVINRQCPDIDLELLRS